MAGPLHKASPPLVDLTDCNRRRLHFSDLGNGHCINGSSRKRRKFLLAAQHTQSRDTSPREHFPITQELTHSPLIPTLLLLVLFIRLLFAHSPAQPSLSSVTFNPVKPAKPPLHPCIHPPIHLPDPSPPACPPNPSHFHAHHHHISSNPIPFHIQLCILHLYIIASQTVSPVPTR